MCGLALALLEYRGIAAGIAAVDRMLKRSPVALLRCGTIHPGRFLVLVGGSVASTQEAHAEGVAVGREGGVLLDEVCLADPHPALAAALAGNRLKPDGEALGVIEIATSPTLLRVLDAALKTVPVELVEVRLGDDLGGQAVALVAGRLTDVQAALETVAELADGRRVAVATSLLARLDDTLRRVVGESTHFAACSTWNPDGAEVLEEEPCSSDA